jgi:hypothetical protein
VSDDRPKVLGGIAYDALARLVRDRLFRTGGGHLLEATLERIPLRLDVALRGEEADGDRFAETLIGAIDGFLDDAVQHAAAFRPGRAFCLRCGASDCEHSGVPSARHVFSEYSPTGIPLWIDFAQACLDRKREEVDRLFEDPPAFVTWIDSPGRLEGRVVRAFRGEGRFELLGQVVAGFYPLRTREGEGRGVLALTFQAAASRGRHGGRRVALNVLGRAPRGEALDLLWDREDAIPWRAAVRWAQDALSTLTRREAEGSGPSSRVEAILRGLARRLERDRRARARRTRHAQTRHASGERPTRKARDDARHAEAREILFDERNGTFVVPGERGRTHFYTTEGRLVSSVRYTKEAVARKVKLGLWKEAGREEAEAILSRIEGR